MWVLSLWIALFDTVAGVTVDCECFHYGLHCLVGYGEAADPLPWVNSSFGAAAAPGLQTPGTGDGPRAWLQTQASESEHPLRMP